MYHRCILAYEEKVQSTKINVNALLLLSAVYASITLKDKVRMKQCSFHFWKFIAISERAWYENLRMGKETLMVYAQNYNMQMRRTYTHMYHYRLPFLLNNM